jgi:hypothetical protein
MEIWKISRRKTLSLPDRLSLLHYMPKDQSAKNRTPQQKGDKIISPPKKASAHGNENKRQISSSGGMTPSGGTLGGYPSGA